MAKATVERWQTEKTIIVDAPVLFLELDEDEARFLYDMLRRVTGSKIESRRRLSDRIEGAIRIAGVEARVARDLAGSIHCKDNK